MSISKNNIILASDIFDKITSDNDIAYAIQQDSVAYGRSATGFNLPAGGTWFVFASMDNRDGSTFACPSPTIASGGTYIGWNPHNGQTSYSWIAIRVS